jgi:hypothetical protein
VSEIKKTLEARKAALKKKLAALKPLQDELEEVEGLLAHYNKSRRHGRERDGHEDGCRCGECDPSW